MIQIDAEELIEFIVYERNRVEKENDISVLVANGYVEACNKILDFIHDANSESNEVEE